MEGTNERQQVTKRYKDLRQLRQQRLSHIKRQSNFVALLRLVLFVSAFAIPFVFFQSWSLSFFLVFGILFTLFLFSVYLAFRLGQQKKENQTYLDLYDKELRIINWEWTDEPDGAEYINPEHDFSHDLDLFGKGSIYQYINRSATKGGRQKLAEKLNSISLNKEEILKKQEAIKELAGNTEFREAFFVRAKLVEESRKTKKDFDLQNQPILDFVSGFLKYVIQAFPIITVLIISLAVLDFIPSSSVLIWFFVGLGVTGQYFRRVNRVHSEITTLGGYLNNYSSLIKLFENYQTDSEYLAGLQQQLKTKGKSASDTVKGLSKAIQFIDQRLNMLMGAILNGFFLWDLIGCLTLQKWYKNYGSRLIVWIDALTEVEALNSFATFAYNHPEAIWPEVSSKVILNAADLGHPLIPQKERVCNDFSIDDDHRICVVTGANMAGKSTFLRTVGVNMVLAANGCKVTAGEFVYKPMTFITNMRAIDNLLKHESYFFAELSRLQMIVERLKEKGELFFILDEILKGTNSHDKTQGSIALIKQLLKLNGSGIVATHDLELGELQSQHPGEIFNNCFEVSFEHDGLQFDYKLRNGVTQSHNASFLMRKMGLIPND
ncbi:MutS-related protein [Carboxylicivirga linearis]|uniref:DNA mismatch repair proteins mutS family domain-containing protein n=1 Tax=Carboxylicivirga linearis TaxID=1628157 RepID=A0ABS5JPM1_9BACT|nr:hypothetical protein [Carboxylicivirga linearis]MBS2096717.1 hypothetical protein [Carboxylicivirga linearis]